jgi:Ca2+-binding RTX toxin-like protein
VANKQISRLLEFINMQMGAEAFLSQSSDDTPNRPPEQQVEQRLVQGNTHISKFTPVQAGAFVRDYEVLTQYRNDPLLAGGAGFSATLFRCRVSDHARGLVEGELTLSIRSTEFRDDAVRDNKATNELEIKQLGWALGQISEMEDWYRNTLLADDSLLKGKTFNVTGYSLGGHLATAFNILRQEDFEKTGTSNPINATYTFNGAGTGAILDGHRLTDLIGDFDRIRANYSVSPEWTSLSPGDQNLVKAQAQSRVDEILAERARVAGLPGVDPAFGTSGPSGSQILLGYQIAAFLVGQYTIGASNFPLPGGTNYIPSSPKYADLRILSMTEIVGMETDGLATSFISNSGVHYGIRQEIAIEGQPKSRGTYVTDFFDQWFNLLVENPSKNDFGDTHSLVLLVDSLSLMAAMEALDPRITPESAATIYAAMSSAKASSVYNGQGYAEGDTLERTLDAIYDLIAGPGQSPHLDYKSVLKGNTWHLEDARKSFHEKLQKLNSTISDLIKASSQSFSIQSLTGLPVNNLAEAAKLNDESGKAYRYALMALNAFAIVGSDSLYDPHNRNGELNLYDLENDTGLTDGWIDARSDMVVSLLRYNTRNGGAAAGITKRYEDRATGTALGLAAGLERVVFGGTTKDTIIGGDARDKLFGGDSRDILNGLSDDDYVEGNAGNDGLEGGTGNDELHGGADVDRLDGGPGDDKLYGEGGDDTLYGNADDDLLIGGRGNDVLDGGKGFDRYLASPGDAALDEEGDGFDTIIDYREGGTKRGQITFAGQDLTGAKTIVDPNNPKLFTDGAGIRYFYTGQPGSTGMLTIYLPGFRGDLRLLDFKSGDFGIEIPAVDPLAKSVLNGTDDADSLSTTALLQKIFGFGGNDRILLNLAEAEGWGGIGNDYITNGEGNQYLYGEEGDDILIASEGEDELYGGTENDALQGGLDDDYLSGDEGNDIASGGAGNDVIEGGEGNDFLFGDLNIVAQGFGGYQEGSILDAQGQGWFISHNPGDSSPIFLTGFTGQPQPGGEDGADVIDGGAGDDYVYAGGGNDLVIGGEGNDHLSGDGGADTVFGDEGDDILWGDASTFETGQYNSVDFADHGNDFLDGGAGDDFIYGQGGNDSVYGGDGDDNITGDQVDLDVAYHGDDYLDGGAGDDHIWGDGGADILYGGDGDDYVDGDAQLVDENAHGDDFLDGGAGTDNMLGGGGNDILYGGEGDDQMAGDSGGQYFLSNEGDDYLDGGAGDDSIGGDGGDDILVGGTGNDFLTGGEGDDAYVFALGDGHDTLEDSGGADQIQFGEGISATGVIVYEVDENPGYLIVKYADADTIAIKDGLDGTIDSVQYADGTLETWAEFLAHALEAPRDMAGTAGNDDISGGWGGDGISGDAGDDLLFGGAGDDHLSGGAGEDQLSGGTGNDTLDGGTDFDTLFGGLGDDTYIFNAGDGHDTIDDAAGYNTVEFGEGIDVADISAFIGIGTTDGAEYLTLKYSESDDVGFKEAATGGIAAYSFADGELLDVDAIERLALIGTTLELGDASDNTFDGTSGTDVIVARAGNDSIAGGDGSDYLSGGAGNDTLRGNGGNDVIAGNAGNDLLIGGLGLDTFVFRPGDGQDVIRKEPVFAIIGQPPVHDPVPDVIRLGFTPGQTSVSIGANLVFRFTTGDSLTVEGGLTPQFGSIAVDRVEFKDGTVWDLATIKAKSLLGTAGPDILVGFDTDDLIEGYGGNDSLYGANGNDTLRGGDGSDFLDGGQGDDVIEGGNANDSLFGWSGSDALVGGAGNDSLYGGVGNEVYEIVAGSGLDTVTEYAFDIGDDTVKLVGNWTADNLHFYKSGDHLIVEFSAGQGVAIASWFPQYEAGQLAIEHFESDSGPLAPDDMYTGYVRDRLITGTAGDDHLIGNAYESIIVGGEGDDVLDGGAGADTYQFEVGDGVDNVVESGGDTVIEFGAGIDPTKIRLISEEVGGQAQFRIAYAANDAIVFADNPGAPATEAIAGFRFSGGLEVTFDEMLALADGIIRQGSPGTDIMLGGDRTDNLFGGDGDDTIIGRYGNDLLVGGRGNDYMDAQNAGADLFAGTGWQNQYRTADSDLFYFSPGDGQDVITYSHAVAQGGYDAIVFGPGVLPQDVSITLVSAEQKTGYRYYLFEGGNFVDYADTLSELNRTWWQGASPVYFQEWLTSGAHASPFAYTHFTYEIEYGDTDRIQVSFDANGYFSSTDGSSLTASTNVYNYDADGSGNVEERWSNVIDDASPIKRMFFTEGLGLSQSDLSRIAGRHFSLGANGRNPGIVPPYLPDVSSTRLFDILIANNNALPSSRTVDMSLLDLSPDTAEPGLTLGDFNFALHKLSDFTTDVMDGDIYYGTEGSDVMTGSNGPDSMFGFGDDDVMVGRAGDDYLYGGDGNDTLDGGSGSDFLSGDAGDDTYVFGRGSGNDQVFDLDATPGNVDRVQLGVDVLPADVTLSRDSQNLYLTITDTGERLAMLGWFTGQDQKVEEIRFEDGTTLDIAAIEARVPSVGTDGDDTLAGDDGDNVIDALGGNDVVYGGGGNDALYGGTGDDTLFGEAGDDTLDGGPGDDTLTGGLGDDTYRFGLGDGVDTIDEGVYTGGTDTLEFGAGITPDSLTLDIGSLLIHVGTGGDAVHIANYDQGSGVYRVPIEQFKFADGTVLSSSELLARGFDITGTADNDVLRGTDVNDRIRGLDGDDSLLGFDGDDILDGGPGKDSFDGGPGNNILIGGSGGDRYTVRSGSNNVIVDSHIAGDINRINMRLAAPSGLTIYRQGDDIVLDAAGGRLVIAGWYLSAARPIDLIEFFTEDEWTAADLDSKVTGINNAPVLTSAIADQAAVEDALFTYTVPVETFADPDPGDRLSYGASLVDGGALPSWLTFDSETMTFGGTPGNGDVGTVAIQITATDYGGLVASDAFDLVIANANDAPILVSELANHSATEDSPFAFVIPTAAFDDVDAGDTLAYTATLAGGSGLPAWLAFNAGSRAFSGTPGNEDVGTISIKVTATDTEGLSADDVFDLTITNVNDAPTAGTAISAQSTLEDASFSFTVPASAFSDVDVGDTLTLTAALAGGGALPGWLTFEAGAFTGTPLNADVGTLHVQVTATDDAGAGAQQVFDLTVVNTNDAPALVEDVGDQAATEDATFSLQLPAGMFADMDANDTITLAATLGNGEPLPAWLAFDASTRTFTGTPGNTDVGTLALKVIVTDAAGDAVADTFNLVIANVNDAPTLEAPLTDQPVLEDSPFVFQLPAGTFADVDAGDSLNLSATRADGSPLPAWLTFDAATRTFAGTPTNADVGHLSVRVTATDVAGDTVSDTFVLAVINTNDAPALQSPLADQTANSGTGFSFQFAPGAFADVDVGDTLTYAASLVSGGTLPAWLAFDAASRTFTGTPAGGDVGTIRIRVTATDNGGLAASDDFALMVQGSSGVTLIGTSSGETLTGGAGDDTLDGAAGADILNGSGGNDLLRYAVDSKWNSGFVAQNVGSPGNPGTNATAQITGKNRSYEVFVGGAGDDAIEGTAGDDALFLDDQYSLFLGNVRRARLDGIERINAGGGNDVVDLTSTLYSYGNVTLDGGNGNDVLWASAGNDVLFGGAGNDDLFGGAGSDFLSGGEGNDTLNGDRGNDLLEGGPGNDTLKDTFGNNLLYAGAGNDSLTGGTGNELFIGGTGNDTLTLGKGRDVIAFNRGDGADTVGAVSGQTAALSLGGGIAYEDMFLRKDGNNLVVEAGPGDRITFANWYSGTGNRGVGTLQVIAEAMAGFDANPADTLRDDRIETFDFQKLVQAFDAARAASPTVNRWAVTHALLDAHLAGSDTEALGGDLAYRYGLAGTLAGIGTGPALAVLGDPRLGSGAQPLQPLSALQEGLVKLG